MGTGHLSFDNANYMAMGMKFIHPILLLEVEMGLLVGNM